MTKVKEKLKELKITYVPDFSGKLDNALEKVAKEFGYKFDSSGYDFETMERDLLFTKE